jgi:hypothetical protein
MTRICSPARPFPRLGLLFAAAILCILPLSAPRAAGPAQQEFASAEAAATGLVDALRAGDRKAILRVLGPDGERLIASGDPVSDKNMRDRFVSAYDAKHVLQTRGPDLADLVVGPDGWPLPIPIVQVAGRWHFDTATGIQQLIDRRIGKNELMTIRALLAAVEAQKDYFARSQSATGTGVYAQRFASTPGTTDGLYWTAGEGEAPSPLGPLVDQALEEGYPGASRPGGRPMPYHGYLFRILKAQGPNAPDGARSYMRGGRMTDGFAVVAWPAEYGRSGIVTFMINQDDVVFQKDLGPNTAKRVGAITRFDPDLTWARVDTTQ